MNIKNKLKYLFIKDEDFKNKYKRIIETIKEPHFSSVAKIYIMCYLESAIKEYPKDNCYLDIIIKTLDNIPTCDLSYGMFIYENIRDLEFFMSKDEEMFLSLILLHKEKVYTFNRLSKSVQNVLTNKTISFNQLLRLYEIGFGYSEVKYILEHEKIVNEFGIDMIISILENTVEFRNISNKYEVIKFLEAILENKNILTKKEFVNNTLNKLTEYSLNNFDAFANLSYLTFYIKNCSMLSLENFSNFIDILNEVEETNIKNNITQICSDAPYLLDKLNKNYLEKIVLLENFILSLDKNKFENINKKIYYLLTEKNFSYNRFELIDIICDMKNFDLLECLLNNLDKYIGLNGTSLNTRIIFDLKWYFRDCQETNENVVMRRLIKIGTNI